MTAMSPHGLPRWLHMDPALTSVNSLERNEKSIKNVHMCSIYIYVWLKLIEISFETLPLLETLRLSSWVQGPIGG